jgi:hypothetical protein
VIVYERSKIVAYIGQLAKMAYGFAERAANKMIVLQRYCSRRMRRAAAAALGIVFVIPGAAMAGGPKAPAVNQPPVLASFFAGRTLVVSSRYGDISMRFSHDGTIVASSPAPLSAGDRGRWWVSQQRICVQWQTWKDGQPHCFAIERTGTSILRWRADTGEEGVARFEELGTGTR